MTRERKYSTTTEDDGVDYREIAETMTRLGFPMRHSSARNHVVYTLKKFVAAYAIYVFKKNVTDSEMLEIAKNPMFQSGVAELLHALEVQIRRERCQCASQIVISHGDIETASSTEGHAGAAVETQKDDLKKVARGSGFDHILRRLAEM